MTLGVGGCYATAYDVPVEADYYDDAPPATFIATAPVYYYGGHPVYWYRSHWHYREGERWRRFRAEPAPLRGYHGGMRPMPGPGAPAGRPLPMERGRPAPQVAPAASSPGARPMFRGRMYERPGRSHR